MRGCWTPFLGLLQNDRPQSQVFRAYLRSVITKKLGRSEPALIDDLVSKTILSLLQRLATRILEDAPPLAWSQAFFRAAAENTVRDYRRNLQRQRSVFSSAEVDVAEAVSSEPSAEERFDAAHTYIRSRAFLIDCADTVGPDATRAWLNHEAANATDFSPPKSAAHVRQERRLRQKVCQEAAQRLVEAELKARHGSKAAFFVQVCVRSHGNRNVFLVPQMDHVRPLLSWLEAARKNPHAVVRSGAARLELHFQDLEPLARAMAQVLQRAEARVTSFSCPATPRLRLAEDHHQQKRTRKGPLGAARSVKQERDGAS